MDGEMSRCRKSGSRSQSEGVVPAGTDVVSGQRKLFQLSFCNLPTFPLNFLIELSFHGQPSGGCRASDECKHHLKATQRLASPVYADLTEQPIFHWIPFGTTCRIVTYGDRQAEGIARLFL